MIIRPATPANFPAIKQLLHELDLAENPQLKNFWVAEIDHKIIGVVQIDEYPDFIFISNLGVAKKFQKQKIASKILQQTLVHYAKPAYLHTIIPEFYIKNGFKIVTDFTAVAKNLSECQFCQPEKCVAMQKLPT